MDRSLPWKLPAHGAGEPAECVATFPASSAGLLHRLEIRMSHLLEVNEDSGIFITLVWTNVGRDRSIANLGEHATRLAALAAGDRGPIAHEG